jgi:hypothetical protein
MTETERVVVWLTRVEESINAIKYAYDKKTISKADLLEFIRDNYETLSVMKKVASGNAYMKGIPPKGL